MKTLVSFLPLLAVMVFFAAKCKDNECEKLSIDECDGKVANGVKCMRTGNYCSEDTDVFTAFRSQERSFVADLSSKNNGYGLDHGETLNWGALCGEESKSEPLTLLLDSITFTFVKGKTQVKVALDCKEGGREYVFPYGARTFENDLKIKIGPDNQKVEADLIYDTGKINQLEFFFKPSWFYFDADKTIKGSAVLADFGFNYNKMDINTPSDFAKALKFAQESDGYNIADNVGAITLIFKQQE